MNLLYRTYKELEDDLYSPNLSDTDRTRGEQQFTSTLEAALAKMAERASMDPEWTLSKSTTVRVTKDG